MTLLDQLKQLVTNSGSRYTRLILVLGQHGSSKSRLLRDFARDWGRSVMEAGALLPPPLFDVSSGKRAVAAADHIGDMIRAAPDPALLDNVEVLFQPQLSLDPLKLFQDNARNRTLIVAWPGSFDGKALTFAEPGHPEFRTYTAPDAQVLSVGSQEDR